MVLLVDYLTQLDIVLIMQKMEAVSFSRFRRASKRLYKLADEAKNLSVMVDRRLFLYEENEPRHHYTLKAAICRMRFDIVWNCCGFGTYGPPPQGSIVIPLGNSSPFTGFTFSQLEMTRHFVSSGCKKGSKFSILKDCSWKRTTLITERLTDSLFEVVQPKELCLAYYLTFVHSSKPLPLSIKRVNYFYASLRMEIFLLKHIKHVVYHCMKDDSKQLIRDYFEYWFYENGVMTEIFEVCPSRTSDFPVVLSTEGAIKHVEDTAFEIIVPHFNNLYWEKIDSSVMYCNNTLNNNSQHEDKTNLEMFDMKLTNRAKWKNQWIYIVLKWKAIRPWEFSSNLQIRFLNRF